MSDNSAFAVEIPILADLDCALEYLSALQLRGLERRKMFSELVQYGCVATLPWVYFVRLEETRTVTVGDQSFILHRVFAIIDDAVIGFMPRMAPADVRAKGWALDTDLIKMSEGELREELRRKRASLANPLLSSNCAMLGEGIGQLSA